MKADHRHELKTNELADWIAHFPQWADENRTTLIATGAVIVVAIVVYFVTFRRQDTELARQEVQLTNLVTQLPTQEEKIAAGLAQGLDQSVALMPIAESLGEFAGLAKKNAMAALALIARGDALRADLHYRITEVARADIARQIADAQSSYRAALERAPSIPALAAAADFGLGMCEEELGNFDKARQMYSELADDPAYNGTAAQAAAAQRLETMDDYKTAVVFKPAATPPAAATTPNVQVQPGAMIPPAMTPAVPNETTGMAPNTPMPAQTSGTPVPESNAPAGN